MIINAKDKDLNQTFSNLPDMSRTIMSWFQDLKFGKVTRENVNADWKETIEEISTKGVVQPPKDEILKVMAEGMRFWEWQMIHCLPNLQLINNEYIYYEGKKYKVMDKKNYEKYGYVRYMILEAFRADTVRI